MGPIDKRVKRLERDDEGKFIRFKLPDGRIRTISKERLSIVEFAIGVGQAYGEEPDTSDPDTEAAYLGTRIDASGRPIKPNS